MGDSRKADYDKYEMAPTTDPEKGREMEQQKQAEWTGLGKEELLRVANTPTWTWSRRILLILFWVAWLGMLVAAIVIVVKVPRCPEVEWWEKHGVYQVFPRSFRDSDGDGYGDIKGVTENLDYLKRIGVKVIYMNSIFEQPNVTTDIGYDIVNFTNVDRLLGNLTDFDNLVMAIGEEEMKLILEFVPNHSSEKHPWFMDSKMAKDSMYSDYYIWANGTDNSESIPPNEWKNAYGESAWTYVEERRQYYYHHFLSSQPDLNYNNESLNREMMDAMKFWLDRKIDGFVFTNVEFVVEPQLVNVVVAPGDATVSRRRRQVTEQPTEAATMPAAAEPPAPTGTVAAGGAAGLPQTAAATDAPVAATDAPVAATDAPVAEPSPGSTQMPAGDASDPYYTTGDKAEAGKEKLTSLLKEWRSLLNNASYLGKYRLMVTQSKFDLDMVLMQYGKNDTYLADYPINMVLADVLENPLDGNKIMKAVNDFIDAKKQVGAEGRWNTWVLGSHDMKRIGSRVGESYVAALNMLIYTLPGTPISYYGEELGVEDIEIGSWDDVVDPVAKEHPAKWEELTRDKERAPLPWGANKFGNFTTGNSTWLPLPDVSKVNIELLEGAENSVLKQFTTLAEYHSKSAIVAGDFIPVKTTSSIISYVRFYPDWPSYMVAMNLGTAEVMENFHTANSASVPEEGMVIISTTGQKKDSISMDGMKLMPGEAVLVEFPAA